MKKEPIAILHYSAPPVVGGVENVIRAHVRLLGAAGYPVTVVAGEGDAEALPAGAEWIRIPELNTRHPDIAQASHELEQGRIPPDFGALAAHIERRLAPVFRHADQVIVHNVLTKHFNLPFTAALCSLLDQDGLRGCIAWCHDFSWTSAHSRSRVFPGPPWDLLRTLRADVHYVTVSRARQRELAGLLGCSPDRISVVYNGVEPQELLGLSQAGQALIERLGLWTADLVLLMPVRVTQAKNIESAIRLAAALKARGVHPRIILTGPPDPHDQDNLLYFQSLLALRQALGVEREMRFVYESGPDTSRPYTVGMQVIGDLYRVSDALFMPSHREGFGMPILEAGLAGLPVFCTAIPAAEELGGEDVVIFQAEADAGDIAALILDRLENTPTWRLRRRVRQQLSWQSIFEHAFLPLLQRGAP